MFRQLKEIFGKSEEPPVILEYQDLPGWVSSELDQVRRKEEDLVRATRGGILESIDELKEQVRSLGSETQKEGIHPKLGKVVDNSLPQYKKAMNSALSRTFPEEPEKFYTAVTECLKGCVKSSAGPGRYLVGVFPDEMKAIRASIDRVGREVNAMNPHFANARKKREQLAAIERIFQSHNDSAGELQHLVSELPGVTSGRESISAECQALKEKMNHLIHDPREALILDLHKKEDLLVREREGLEGERLSLVAMVIHALRRCEKVAQRERDPDLSKKIHALAENLAKEDPQPGDELWREFSVLVPRIRGMVEKGDVTFRNSEESDYFSDPGLLPHRIGEIKTRISQAETEITGIREECANNEFVRERNTLGHHLEKKTKDLEEIQRKEDATRKRISALEESIPQLEKDLQTRIHEYSEKPVKINIPGVSPTNT